MSLITQLYTDGGVCGRNPSPVGGTWAWRAVDSAGDIVASGSGWFLACDRACGARSHWPLRGPITNNQMEIIAIILGLEALPPGWVGYVYSDSMVALRNVLARKRASNFPPEWHERLRWATRRHRAVLGELVGGHPSKADLVAGKRARDGKPVSAHNVWCDQACNHEKGPLLEAYQRLLDAKQLHCQGA